MPQGLRNRHALREAALSTMSTRELLDTALVTMQMARFAGAAGDATAATTALACADAALTGYQAALGTALRSPRELTESAVSSAPQRAAETDEIDETPPLGPRCTRLRALGGGQPVRAFECNSGSTSRPLARP